MCGNTGKVGIHLTLWEGNGDAKVFCRLKRCCFNYFETTDGRHTLKFGIPYLWTLDAGKNVDN